MAAPCHQLFNGYLGEACLFSAQSLKLALLDVMALCLQPLPSPVVSVSDYVLVSEVSLRSLSEWNTKSQSEEPV